MSGIKEFINGSQQLLFGKDVITSDGEKKLLQFKLLLAQELFIWDYYFYGSRI